jgi:hypothetical protein
MEFGKTPFNVTIRWRDIGKATVAWAFEHIMPNADGYRSNHFSHGLVETEAGVEVLEPNDIVGFYYDELGYQQPLHTTVDKFVMNRTETEMGWDDKFDSEGCYTDRENL